jgi:hypothetical protein
MTSMSRGNISGITSPRGGAYNDYWRVRLGLSMSLKFVSNWSHPAAVFVDYQASTSQGVPMADWQYAQHSRIGGHQSE